jgi:hypothetical protein
MTDTTTVETSPTSGGGLRPVSDTAAHERARLEARAGRSRLTAALSRLALGMRHLGSEQAAKSGLRYQPVAWTVIAIVAIAFYFPGRLDVAPLAGELARTPETRVPTATSTTAVPLPASPNLGLTPTPVFTAPSPPYSSFTPPPTFAATTPTTLSTEATVALAVRGFGWAASLPGTGVGPGAVPAGTMPVGVRLGELDKVSFLRLSGTADTLTLHEDTSGAREALGAGAVRACAIVEDDWAEQPDQAMADAPKIDTNHCVAGEEVDNIWTFDLSAFANRTGQSGFALLPTASAPADFQLTFAPA